jgi:LPXTG-site transpeptidase (sortase) family protein
MISKLPKKKRRRANFVKAAKRKIKIQAVSLNEQELTVLKSISALCGGSIGQDAVFVGGSGVGQAPEPPTRIDGCWAALRLASLAQGYKLLGVGQASGERSRTTPEPFDHSFSLRFQDFKPFDVAQGFQPPQKADLREANESFKIQDSREDPSPSPKMVRDQDDVNVIFLPSFPKYLQVAQIFPIWSKITKEVLLGLVEMKFVGAVLQKIRKRFRIKFKGKLRGILREFRGEKYFSETVKQQDGETVNIKQGNTEIRKTIGGMEIQPQDRVIERKRGVVKEDGRVRKFIQSGVAAGSWMLIFLGFVGIVFTYGPVLKAEVGYQIKNKLQIARSSSFVKTLDGKQNPKIQKPENPKSLEKYSVVAKPTSKIISNSKIQIFKNNNVKGDSALKELPLTNENDINSVKFVSDISIAIPKIDAYAQVFLNTNPANRDEYLPILQKGVAHAVGTAMPGETGNVYLFAHSAGDLLEMARMNAVFYLISKLESGDKIYMKFGDRKFVYTVYAKQEVEPDQIQYINNRQDNGKMMTLQTCTPPGTDWRRLLVFAKIQE